MGECARTYLAVDYPDAIAGHRQRCVFEVALGAATRADAETRGTPIATRRLYLRHDGTEAAGQWWPTGRRYQLPAGEVLDGAPIVGRPAPPPPPVALAIDVCAWCALEERRARLKAMCAWSKGPGVMETPLLAADLADRVRAVGRELGVMVEDVAVPARAGAP